MVINDFERDARAMIGKKGKTKADVGREMGTEREAIRSYIRDAGVTKAYTELIAAIGYDIQVTYVEGESGVLTDFKEDYERLLAEAGYRKTDLAKEMGVGLDWLRGALRRAGVTKGYVKLCTHLGYGIKLEYIPYMR